MQGGNKLSSEKLREFIDLLSGGVITKSIEDDLLDELTKSIIKSHKDFVDERKNLGLFENTSTSKLTIEIEVDHDFDSFTEEKELDLLYSIKTILNLQKMIKWIGSRRGSVKITLEMNSDEAERLFIAIKTGKLNHIGITNAKLVDFKKANSHLTDPNGLNIDSIKQYLKNQLTSNHKFALEELRRMIKFRDNNDILLATTRFNDLNKNYENGTIDFAEYTVQLNKITASIFSIIDRVTENDIKYFDVIEEGGSRKK